MSKAKTLVSVKQTSSGVDALSKAFEKLKRSAIYVGIANDSSKNDREETPIKNSELGWIHERGSPSSNIPARPFLEPGVLSVKDDIKKKMEMAASAMLDGNESEAEAVLSSIASDSAEAVRNYVRKNNSSFAPLASSTLAQRLRKNEKARGGSDITILMDTNQLLRAVDGVVVKE